MKLIPTVYFSNMIKVAYCVLFCLIYVSAYQYSNVEEYYPGYMPDCPGAKKPVYFTPEDMEQITIAVIGSSNKWTSYNYRSIRNLVKHPGFDLNNKIFMYISGYMDLTTISTPLGKNIAMLYRNLGYTVMVVDATAFTYRDLSWTARYIPAIGKHVAGILANMTTYGLDPKKLNLLGFSTGAQTMSFIAKNYRDITGRNISSLTALDPGGPCFRHLGPNRRLDPSDADFVLSVATNIDGYGMATPVGHVTFYVNGGEFQAAELIAFPCTLECSHVKAYVYWVAALLNPKTFVGIQCDSVQQAKYFDCYDRKPQVSNTMDLFVDRSKPGIYYVPASNLYPYSLGTKGMEKKNNPVINVLNFYNTDVVTI